MTAAPRPLRVLTCLHSMEPGGVERDVLRFVPAWRTAGIDARIALGRREGRLQEEAPDVPYFDMGGLGTSGRETLWMISKLPAVIRAFRPDVLLIASNGLAVVGLAMRLWFGRRCPAIVFRVSNDLVRRDMSRLEIVADRVAMHAHAWIHARVVAMAAPMIDQIMQQMGVTRDRIVVINNGSLTAADLQALATDRDRAVRTHDGRRFLGVGRLMPQKNFALLIEAFARIARDHDRLTIVGEGADRALLERRIVALGLAAKVALPGHMVPANAWFADADAFILSSDFEGLPAVIVEALAAGLPIVATECCAAMPMLVEGAGQLVPIRDAAALAEAMDQILERRIDVAAMRARAGGFTIEATTAQWRTLFEGLAQ